jgi:hypothetical protein
MAITPAGNAGTISGLADTDFLDSTQRRFARLQLSLAATTKQGAMQYIKSIEDTQKEQQMVGDFLQQARQLQTAAAAAGSKNSEMPDAMHDYFTQNKLAMGSTDDQSNTKDEWEMNITSLKARLDQLGTDTQQKMVFVQDFMGQSNSYMQGAGSSNQQANQVLGELLRVR